MRISIPVVSSAMDKEQEFAIEVDKDDGVITFYLDSEQLFKTDVENFEDLVTAYGLIWGVWIKIEQEKRGNGEK